MAPCCNNIVTPRMIKAGNVSVGDKINLDDFALPKSAPVSAQVPSDISSASAGDQAAVRASAGAAADDKQYIPVQAAMTDISGNQNQTGAHAQNAQAHLGSLPYSQMTQYMSNVSMGGSVNEPSIVMPQAPMTPNGYNEEISYDSVQSLNGFLRTQIGRYMRVEQLIGSNTIQDRFGFLVGVGSNFILLQEITTGNIMVLDIFSIRLTYIYYSQPVIPDL